jgi:hypothetical protein
MRSIIFLVASALLMGCASHSGVVPLGNDTFTISRQAATGIGGMGNLRPDVLTEATQHCAAQNKTMQVTSERQSQPPYILGNYPRIDLEFRCVPNPQ